MQNFIRELYHGNISPQEKCFDHHSDYGKALDIVAKNEELLIKFLDGKEKEQFLSYVDACSEVLSISNCETFVDGFRIGAAFVLDAFINTDNEFKDIR